MPRNVPEMVPSRNLLPAALVAILLSCVGAGAIAQTGATKSEVHGLTAERLFEPDHLVDVRVELPPKDWQSLCIQARNVATALGKRPGKRPYTYFKGHVTIDGVRIENVGIRKKGFFGSVDDERPSLKIKFDAFEDQSPVEGLDRITLNNNKQDASQAIQVLAYRLFRKAGLRAPRCNHAKVTVNGQSLGIYSHIDSVRRPFLRHAFGNDTGALYEGAAADLVPGNLGRFQPKGKTTGVAVLEPIARALAADPVDFATIEKHLDVDAFLGFWAMETLVSFWDGYANAQNNYYVYHDAKSAKLHFIPWGMDAGFTSRMPAPPYFIRIKTVFHRSALTNRLYRIPSVRKRYREVFESFLTDVWDEADLNTELDRITALVKDHLHPRQRRFPGAVKKIRSWVKARRKILNRQLAKWPPRIPTGARNPIYMDSVGEAKGSFSTTWEGGSRSSKAEFELTIGGKRVELERLRVTSGTSAWPTLGGGPKPPAITIKASRKSDGKDLVLMLIPGRLAFRLGDGRPTVTQGALVEGGLAALSGTGTKPIGGTVTIEAGGMTPGAEVRGKFAVKIVQMKGGETPRYEGN